MKLTLELRENAGLQWVLERLSPLSPFGRTAARDLPWYGPGDEAALEEELTTWRCPWSCGTPATPGLRRYPPADAGRWSSPRRT